MSNRQTVKQRFFIQDPLWGETPAMGAEGLIATIKDKKVLVRELAEHKNQERSMMGKD